MSAQDDVLAAFGEPRKRFVEPEPEPEPVPAAEPEPVAEPEPEAESESEPVAEIAADQMLADETPVGETPVSETPVGEQNGARGEGEPDEAEQLAAGESALADTMAGPAEPATESAPGEAPAEVTTAPPTATTPEPFAQAGQPYLDPSAFFTQLQAESAPKKRRWPRLIMRYGSALIVAGAVGAGTAYAVTVPRRTDVPFLATPNDGRYAFPAVSKPVPPAGKPAPGDEANSGQVHYGDLRQYLLPAPKGAVLKEDGWEPAAGLENAITGGTDLNGQFYDAGLRRIAWRGWTAADGQHTVVELLQFPDHTAAYSVLKSLKTFPLNAFGKIEDALPTVTVPLLGEATEDVTLSKFDDVDALPGHVGRRAVFEEGDVVVIVTTTAPKAVTDVATEQVLMLQAGMLR